ncbi:MAG TPA: hypothetical protein VIG33_12285 [Pseudobdellovibrionaceae bacterium]
MNENPCLAEVASKFAVTLAVKDNESSVSTGSPSSLQEKAGEGRYKNFSPGWAWQHALKFTNGDKNAAMFLIGLCAYEEVPMYSFQVTGKHKVALDRRDIEVLEERLMKAKADLKFFQSEKGYESAKASTLSEVSFIQEAIRQKKTSIENPNQPEEHFLKCPDNGSAFTAPGSLGANVDISGELKEKIRHLQRPQGKNLETLKAKYYHITGSAFMGCQLKKCGMPNMVTKLWESQAGRMYRSIRLCGQVKTNLKNIQVISKKIGMDINEPKFRETAKLYLQAEAKKLIVEGQDHVKMRDALYAQGLRGPELTKRLPSYRCNDATLRETNPQVAYLCSATFLQREADSNSEAVAREVGETDRAIDRLLQEYDASIMFRKWYIGGDNIPCTGIKAAGPFQLDGNNPNCEMYGWSAERCSTALAKLGTWDVDFDWTVAQHKVGAEFGAEQCREQDPNEKLDKTFCKILDENNKKELYGEGKAPAPPSEEIQGAR